MEDRRQQPAQALIITLGLPIYMLIGAVMGVFDWYDDVKFAWSLDPARRPEQKS